MIEPEGRPSSDGKISRTKSVVQQLLLYIFIVPATQVYVFDLPYQWYTYRLFHRSFWNRLTHLIGIPVAFVALYSLSEMWFGIGLYVLGVAAGFHLVLAIRHQLWSMLFALLLMHVGIWAAAEYMMIPHVFQLAGEWYLHPGVWVLIFSVVQYLGHLFEPSLPYPLASTSRWSPLWNWLKEESWTRKFSMFLLGPFHIFVEFISGPRNIFLLLLSFLERLGLTSVQWEQIRQTVEARINQPDPVISYRDYNTLYSEESDC